MYSIITEDPVSKKSSVIFNQKFTRLDDAIDALCQYVIRKNTSRFPMYAPFWSKIITQMVNLKLIPPSQKLRVIDMAKESISAFLNTYRDKITKVCRLSDQIIIPCQGSRGSGHQVSRHKCYYEDDNKLRYYIVEKGDPSPLEFEPQPKPTKVVHPPQQVQQQAHQQLQQALQQPIAKQQIQQAHQQPIAKQQVQQAHQQPIAKQQAHQQALQQPIAKQQVRQQAHQRLQQPIAMQQCECYICQAITKAGRRCKNMARYGNLCWIHHRISQKTKLS